MSGAGDRRVVIAGAGAIGPCGEGMPALLEAVRTGRATPAADGPPRRSGGAPGLAARAADSIPPGPFPAGAWRRLDRASRLAAHAAAEALATCGRVPDVGSEEPGIGLVLGSQSAGTGPLRDFILCHATEGPQAVSPLLFPATVPNAPASQCSILLGLTGPNLAICRMEASGLAAVATAADLIRDGAADVMLAGGVDILVPEIEAVWARLRLTARGPAAEHRGPFDRGRRGWVPGEGAYLLLLESGARARGRGAAPWAEVAGTASAHLVGPSYAWPADPAPIARTAALALERAAIGADGPGWIAAGANGTRTLDAVEARALAALPGVRSGSTPVVSVKGVVGESGAASACAAIVAAASIRDGWVPPNAALVEADPDLGLNLPRGETRLLARRSALVMGLGTGGACVAVVLKAPPV